MYKNFFKRFLDFLISLIALIVLLPFLFIIAIWLHFANEGAGIFFCQKRPGKNEKIFKLIKFKSMSDEKDVNGKLLPDSKRITNIGKFVRNTSIDELPQLINVLKGEMSLIGPRPLLIEYLPYYTKEESLRHTVRPGITGWAQINGRNTTSFDDRFKFDVFYVKNMSFKFDLNILFRTIVLVFKRKDVITVPKDIFLDKERSEPNNKKV